MATETPNVYQPLGSEPPGTTNSIQVASRSVPGSQHPYEDRVLVDEGLGLFAVADGVTLSSQGNGGLAASLALSLLRENFKGDLVRAIEDTHRIITAKRKDDWSIGETTLTAIFIEDRTLHAGNVGDSPAYLIRGGEMQSLVQEDRSKWGSITQVIGLSNDLQVHSMDLDLKGGDTVIVASDGVGHVLWHTILEPIMQKPAVADVADAIIEEAKARKVGYDDDKSVIVVRVVP
ncbi:MAG TPA: protein phosphatase 2C domain-containing protein [Nitrososphaerales archaeon]|nr:protein phosphatase 2C domain-containing protein [Nitrososphaerales archaeon]